MKRENAAANDFLERIYHILEVNLDDPDFGVGELAREIAPKQPTRQASAVPLISPSVFGTCTRFLLWNLSEEKKAANVIRFNPCRKPTDAGGIVSAMKWSCPRYFSTPRLKSILAQALFAGTKSTGFGTLVTGPQRWPGYLASKRIS